MNDQILSRKKYYLLTLIFYKKNIEKKVLFDVIYGVNFDKIAATLKSLF